MYKFSSYFLIFSITRQIKKTIKFATTILAPAGVDQPKEATIPMKKQNTEITAEKITTLIKLLKTRIALKAGKTIKLDIIMAPIKRIPITIVRAVKTAISPL